jgi:hypothetical protein
MTLHAIVTTNTFIKPFMFRLTDELFNKMITK